MQSTNEIWEKLCLEHKEAFNNYMKAFSVLDRDFSSYSSLNENGIDSFNQAEINLSLVAEKMKAFVKANT